MEVLKDGPQAWHLLRDGQQLYLDVDRGNSFLRYSVTTQFNNDGTARSRRRGRAYVGELAQAIQYSAPGLSASQSIFKNTLAAPEVTVRVNEAIKLWL